MINEDAADETGSGAVPFAQGGALKQARIRVRRVDHVGVMVTDIDATVKWYVGTLGLTVADRWDNTENAMAWAHLTAGDFRIELVQRPGLASSDAAATGLHHIALVVDDCESATASLVDAGAEVVFAPSHFERHDMDWSFVRDPFGNILEVIAYRAAVGEPVALNHQGDSSRG